jgi:hypothetical protein
MMANKSTLSVHDQIAVFRALCQEYCRPPLNILPAAIEAAVKSGDWDNHPAAKTRG